MEQRHWASAAAVLLQVFGKYLEMYVEGGRGGLKSGAVDPTVGCYARYKGSDCFFVFLRGRPPPPPPARQLSNDPATAGPP